MPRLTLALAALAAALGISAVAGAGHAQPLEPAVSRKLYDLGYVADPKLAVQRWRLDTNRTGTGALSAEETAALLAQAQPESMAAMVGNPFTGLGLAMKHATRAEAEREAIRLCKAQGGGSACARPQVVRADQCVAVVGYQVTIDRRPVYRTTVAVSNEVSRSMDAAKEACPSGATHPELCRPLLAFCGDGREMQVFDADKAEEATTATASAR